MAVRSSQKKVAPVAAPDGSEVTDLGRGMTRIHGRIGEAREFIEFSLKDGTSFFAQRTATGGCEVFRSDKGHSRHLSGIQVSSLVDGEREAKACAERRLAGHSD